VLTQHYGHIVSLGKVLEDLDAAQADSEKLRELLRRIGNTAGRPVAEYYSAEMQREHFFEIIEEISKLVQQALSPSPTPAQDTNTQSLCRAKPSPDSATPPSSSSVGFPSLPPDDAAIHNARRGVISALPGTADRSKALDELVRAEIEDGTYWRIPCRCSESERSQCKLCGGKGWIDAEGLRLGTSKCREKLEPEEYRLAEAHGHEPSPHRTPRLPNRLTMITATVGVLVQVLRGFDRVRTV
jgi:hypothetical protein